MTNEVSHSHIPITVQMQIGFSGDEKNAVAMSPDSAEGPISHELSHVDDVPPRRPQQALGSALGAGVLHEHALVRRPLRLEQVRLELVQRLRVFHDVLRLLPQGFQHLRYAVHVRFDALRSEIQPDVVARAALRYDVVVGEEVVDVANGEAESPPGLGRAARERTHVGARLVREQRGRERGIRSDGLDGRRRRNYCRRHNVSREECPSVV
eukprot:CAMPEP_0172575254 /NCGR_PEP_ID=MMETSP1067-20121228/137123_1 /TAXON_ID=265564 ORGANISM="Thalassiosira punctigera, Strain Tpunct2005C2" /NCGR_SAMPLE_ID=MMETSP1067 /ASSEMBLY_ACC=CAM_ASM_000444 /LENGTH=209 /DNA_ID=CAMNT_0013367903 /DNA_START=343 /DNA_END=973 /DNA_ORIENTATION=+